MTRESGDPQFWLPPMFLSDDVFKETELMPRPLSRSNSGFSSPGDSSVASTRTESDEDEFLTELTRRLTGSLHLSRDLRKTEPNLGLMPSDKTDTLRKMPASPQSTLKDEKAGKITRLEQNCTSEYIHFWAAPQKPKPSLDSVPSNTKHHAHHSNQRILYHQPHEQNGNRHGRTPGLSHSAWPTLQQSQSHKHPPPVSWNTRVALLSNNGGSSGTGVFLPLPRPVATTPTQMPRGKHPGGPKQRNVSAQSEQRMEISRTPAAVDDEIRLPQEWTY